MDEAIKEGPRGIINYTLFVRQRIEPFWGRVGLSAEKHSMDFYRLISMV